MNTTADFKRHALEVGDWLWGAIQGGFNEKLSIGQIVFDAVLSAFPLAGEATAARDVVAQLLKMSRSPKLWQEVMEWVLLILPLLAIVPVFGGLLKGVGKLAMRAGQNAAEDKAILQAVIQLCNRLGHGDAVKFVKQLDFSAYQGKLIDGFNEICRRIDDCLRIIPERMQAILPKDVLEGFADTRDALGKLKEQGSRMIPKAVKELNARLKLIQAQVYEGEWHTVVVGQKNVVRETEGRLVEHGVPPVKPEGKGFRQNSIDDYHHEEGWPDLRRWRKGERENATYPDIEAFSGAMKARTLVGPKTVYRVLKPPKNKKPSPWWTETMPANGQEWRENLAVLDDFNINNFFIKFEIPAGRELKVWEGKAAEQIDKDVGQFLAGGGTQLYIDWPTDLKAMIEKLPLISTGWGKTLKKYGYDTVGDAHRRAIVQPLGKNEYASKQTTKTGT